MTPRRAVVELELISRIDQDGDCTETRTFARGELTRLRDSVTLAYREPTETAGPRSGSRKTDKP